VGSIYQPAPYVKIVMSPAAAVVLGLFAVGALGYLGLGWIARWWVGTDGRAGSNSDGRDRITPTVKSRPRTIRSPYGVAIGKQRPGALPGPVDPLPTDPSRAA
jgi:hypothetical protein